MIAANVEAGGNGAVSGGTKLGEGIACGATGEAESAYYMGKYGCREAAAIGCTWTFAPMEGNYAPEKVLMVGDAPSDYEAAKTNGVLYYPIIPGREVESWSLLRTEAVSKFHCGDYAGVYMTERVDAFNRVLKTDPEW